MRNIKLWMLVVLLVSILCSSCSNTKYNTTYTTKNNDSQSYTGASIVQEKEPEPKIIQQIKTDMDNSGILNEINLLYDKGRLLLKADHSIADLGPAGIDYIAEPPMLKVIMGNNQKNYIAVYDYSLSCGVAGEEYKLFLFKYNNAKGTELLWDGNLAEYEYKYSDNIFHFEFSDFKKEVEGDISNVVKNIESQYKRIEPMSINELLNGSIRMSLSDVGVNDYNGDGSEELITKYDVYNEQLSMYLSSIYAVWKIENDKVYIYNTFIIDLHSFESRVLSEIIEKGYLQYDKLQLLVNENDNVKDYSTQIDKLVQKEIVKIQDSRITIN